MNRYLIAVIAVLVWSISLASGAFFYGKRVQRNADQAEQLVATQKAEAELKAKNQAALGSGVKTEAAQDKVDAKFRELRGKYEIEQRKNPAIGCVLDPVSLRIWNEANQKSDGAAASKHADRVRPTSGADGGAERGE